MISLLPLAPIAALLLAPALAPPAWLRGWRVRLWLAALVGGCAAYILALLPDLDSAGALLGAVAIALGLPVSTTLLLGAAAGWSWRRLLPIGALGVALLVAWAAPALAAEPAALVIPPELVAAYPWLQTIVFGIAVITWLRSQLSKGITVRIELVHTFDALTPRVEIHHPAAPEPDPALHEPSGARPKPRRA